MVGTHLLDVNVAHSADVGVMIRFSASQKGETAGTFLAGGVRARRRSFLFRRRQEVGHFDYLAPPQVAEEGRRFILPKKFAFSIRSCRVDEWAQPRNSRPGPQLHTACPGHGTPRAHPPSLEGVKPMTVISRLALAGNGLTDHADAQMATFCSEAARWASGPKPSGLVAYEPMKTRFRAIICKMASRDICGP
jgi:hypothetical protein